MKITSCIQGNNEAADRDLFGALGSILTDADIHDQLGMAITSRAGDIWHLAADEQGKLQGFALTRMLKDGHAAHIRFLHAVHAPARTQQALLRAVMETAAARGATRLHTNDRANNTVWAKHGFEIVPDSRRGSFRRWQLDMEPNK